MKIDNAVSIKSDYVLVTGANGFLGRHVAKVFAKKGYRVIGIGHGKWTRAEWTAWGLSEWHCVDISLKSLQKYAGHPKAIIHCAGSGSVAFSIQNPLEDFHRTVVTIAHVLEYVRSCSPSTGIVYPSSASVYGSVEFLPIREDAFAAPISQYGVHKLMAEQLVVAFARQCKTPASIVRLFSVYGCGLRKQLLWDACCKFDAGDTMFMGTGEEVRDWLHVEDAAELMLVASEHASSDCPIANGGSGQGVSVQDLLRHLGESLLQKKVIPVFSGIKREGDPSRYIAALGKVKDWGWIPRRSWQEGIKEYAAWWRQSASMSKETHGK